MAPKKRTAPADLSELDKVVEVMEKGIVVPIYHMDGATPLGFGIRVAGPDSNRAAQARAAQSAELTERASLDPLTFEERYAQNTRYLARIAIEFDGTAKLDGKVLENTEEDFYKLFLRFRYIRNQVDLGAASREAFLSEFEKSSGEQSGQSSAET